MSEDAKVKKINLALDLARKEADEAKLKAEDEEIEEDEPKERVFHCKRCHEPKKNYIVVDADNKKKHNCKKLGVRKCRNFAKCKYAAGHPKEANALKRVAKLEKKQKEALERSAKKVWCLFLVVF